MAEVDTTTIDKTESKKLNTGRLIGTVEWFNFSIGYGFILPNDPQFASVFVHKSAFVLKAGTTLKSSVIEHRLLEFDIFEDEERKHAWNVTAIGGLLLTDPILEVYLTPHGFERRRSFRYRNYNNPPLTVIDDDDEEDVALPNRSFNRFSAGYRSFNLPHKRRVSLNEEKSRSGLDENWRERSAENGDNDCGRNRRRRSVSSVRRHRVNDDLTLDTTNQLNVAEIKSNKDCAETKENVAVVESENNKSEECVENKKQNVAVIVEKENDN